MSSSEPTLGARVRDASGHVWTNEHADNPHWTCDCDHPQQRWSWSCILEDATGKIEVVNRGY